LGLKEKPCATEYLEIPRNGLTYTPSDSQDYKKKLHRKYRYIQMILLFCLDAHLF